MGHHFIQVEDFIQEFLFNYLFRINVMKYEDWHSKLHLKTSREASNVNKMIIGTALLGR